MKDKEKQTDRDFRQITIEEYYSKEEGGVYWNWRIVGWGKWNKELTPYEDIPWVTFPTKKVSTKKK